MGIFHVLVWIWIGLALITFFILVIFKIKAPYGRHASRQWGKMVDNHWGWFWMELPALLIFPLLAIWGPAEKNKLSWLLIILWILHYFYRTLIFPFQLRTEGKKMPWLIVLSALFFNGMNGFINGYFLGFLAPMEASILSAHVGIGLILFFGGMYINRTADHQLIELRNGNKGYQVPKGWLFDYISCPNYLGEMLEWAGFAVIAWSLPAASFAIWTFCNLTPRALNHHEWYRQHFQDYPVKRKAVFPYFW
jgi:3-oxo-5-alpha-steroid 4-dehydrogenase 1